MRNLFVRHPKLLYIISAITLVPAINFRTVLPVWIVILLILLATISLVWLFMIGYRRGAEEKRKRTLE